MPLTSGLDTLLKTKLIGFLAPRSLAKVAIRVPFDINQKVISIILNHVFQEQVNEGDFDFLQKNDVLIEIIDAQIFIGISFVDNRLFCNYFDSIAIDTSATLSISTYDVIQLIEQAVDPDTLFFQRKLKIKGNTELAHQVKNTIDNLDYQRLPFVMRKAVVIYKQEFLGNLT